MAKRERRLGRGLSGLIGEVGLVDLPAQVSAPSSPEYQTNTKSSAAQQVRFIDVADIAPSPFQPRLAFDEPSLKSLAESIAGAGVMQPILLRKGGAGAEAPFELIAGERRWRAARLAGLRAIPAIVTDLSDRDAAEWSLVENLQRADLNPIERARAFQRLVADFGATHAEIGARVGVERSSVANLIRLTELEPEIQTLVARGLVSAGHAKALLGAPPGLARLTLTKRCVEEGWSVRRLETRIEALASGAGGGAAPAAHAAPQARRDIARADLEKRLSEALGTKVEIRTAPSGTRGRVIAHFYDLDQFDGLVERLGVRAG
jgi:ParB family chromosome partitioning protein